MPVVLKPSSGLINITVYFVVEQKPHGHEVFHFISSREDFDTWKQKGYTFKEDNQDPSVSEQNNNKVIQQLVTSWKRPLWREHNEMYASCLRQYPTPDGKIKIELDFMRLRDLKLRKCLKGWDAVDEHGNKIPINDDTIDNMIPELANEIIEAFEKVTEIADDDLGN